MRVLFALILLLSGSCATIDALRIATEKIGSAVDATKSIAADVQAVVVSAKADIAAEKKKADTNQDGSVDMSEWVAYLVALIAAGGGGILARNAASNARKTVIETKVAALEAVANAPAKK